MTQNKKFEDTPCKCGSILYNRVDGNPEQVSGWECAICGKSFIEDEEQPVYHNMPYSMRDTLYIEE